MNFKKTFNLFVVVMCALTVFLITALSVSLFGWEQGLIYALILVAFFAGIIGLGLWSQRIKKVVKPVSVEQSSTSGIEIFEIRVQESLKNFEFNPFPFLIALIIILFILNFQFILNEMDISFTSIVFGINTIIVLIFLSVALLLKKELQLKKELIHPFPIRKIVLSSSGLNLPFEILTNSAQQIALKNKEADIFIPWSDIQSWEIYPGGGRAPSQFSLELKGDSKKYASFMGLLGIVRIPEISQNEAKIIEFAKRFLSCDIRYR
jgi:hypothetical protein